MDTAIIVSSKPKAIVVMRPKTVRALVTATNHMLHGYTVEIVGRGRGGRIFALDPDGVELAFAAEELREVES